MNWELHILTECHIDLLLVETISPPKTRYNKQKNCIEIFKMLENEKRQFYNNPAFGIIDNDKDKPKGFSSCVLLREHSEVLSIYKRGNYQYIAVVGSKNKAIEDFILKNAEKCNISLSDYGLPTNLKELLSITKHLNNKREDNHSNITNFIRLFKAINKNKNSDFYKLSEWIKLFKEDPRKINIELLNK